MEERHLEQDYPKHNKEGGGGISARRTIAVWSKQVGANKWRRGLFEGHGEGMEEDHHHPQSEYNWRATAPDKWDTIASGNWIQKAVWRRDRGTGW